MWNVVEQANSPSGAFAHPTILSLLKPISKHYNELKHRLAPSKNRFAPVFCGVFYCQVDEFVNRVIGNIVRVLITFLIERFKASMLFVV